MRELINFIQYLAEDQTLSPEVIKRNPGRYSTFLDMIRNQKPFYNTNKQQVIVDPSEADRIEDLFNNNKFTGIIKLKLITGEQINLGSLLKTKDLGGQARTGEEGEVTGKESALLKPSQINITNKDIPADRLGEEIINNSVLQSTDYGRVVIEMAKSIMSGVNPILPKELPEKIKSSIVDYAGEYLGVLALITGLSSFPRRKGFEEWLGSDVSSLVINFPRSANTNIADSYASIKNKDTNHTINISSKGKGGGAPPSLSGLKIPDEIRSNPKYRTAVDFIDLSEVSENPRFNLPPPKTVSQVFQAMNLLYENYPDSIPKEFFPFLPWEQNIVDKVVSSLNDFKNGKETEKNPLSKYKKLWSNIDFTQPSSFGGKLTYAVKLAVMKAVNEGNAIPEFQTVILAVLDMNFIQQYTKYDSRSKTLVFSTQWPGKLQGYVSLESKSGAPNPRKGGFGFKLSDDTPKTNLPLPNEGPDATQVSTAKPKTDVDFRLGAEKITKGRKTTTDITMQPTQDLGRKERKSK